MLKFEKAQIINFIVCLKFFIAICKNFLKLFLCPNCKKLPSGKNFQLFLFDFFFLEVAEWIKLQPNKILIISSLNISNSDMACSNWSGFPVFLDFGFGPAARFRFPPPVFDGFIVIFPTPKNDGWEILLGLEKNSMKNLENDEELLQYFNFNI